MGSGTRISRAAADDGSGLDQLAEEGIGLALPEAWR